LRYDWKTVVRIPVETLIILSAAASSTALKLTQMSIQLVLGDILPEEKAGRGVKLTAHRHLAPRLKKYENLLPQLYMPSW
jgi:hypothetical protein